MSRIFIDETDRKLYGVWKGIRKRCYSPKCAWYKWYGGKGVLMCDEWYKDYTKFREWAIESGYEQGLTIDRIDNNGNYEPTNCQWITQSENSKKMQQNHRGKTIITYQGETHKLSDWARKNRNKSIYTTAQIKTRVEC
jgi:hypothetical protein